MFYPTMLLLLLEINLACAIFVLPYNAFFVLKTNLMHKVFVFTCNDFVCAFVLPCNFFCVFHYINFFLPCKSYVCVRNKSSEH